MNLPAHDGRALSGPPADASAAGRCAAAPACAVPGPARRNDHRARRHRGWLGFAVHRVSGLLLAVFLPLHFWTLGLALRGEAALDGALRWYEMPVFKLGEWLLVLCLAVHMLGGIRLLVIEFAAWGGMRLRWVSAACAASLAASLVFAAFAWS